MAVVGIPEAELHEGRESTELIHRSVRRPNVHVVRVRRVLDDLKCCGIRIGILNEAIRFTLLTERDKVADDLGRRYQTGIHGRTRSIT
ncbi:hypothetical protein [Paraburkholderia fungorum]|uniref:Uncharacterized protein n=1 Tax=Paraburkholderia fungorum TaxID=134537 RepID=A0A3R7E5Y3_9BURK|nr:hypothetical protein [Paraburkholderia fungorum]RKF43529.1 hypothetical protein BCY88_05980 [Paraburkholderia fungorum]